MSPSRTCAVLFADVTGSTRLYEELGDTAAHARIDELLRHAERAIREHGGRVVKSLGDGLMCAFDAPGGAVRAALAMQLAASERGDAALGIHVGCHHGAVLEAEGDLYGDTVNVAARVAGLANAGQVVVTRDVVDRLDGELSGDVRALGHTYVKGRREPVEIFEYLWQEGEDLTVVRQTVAFASTARAVERVMALTVTAPGIERTFDGGAGDLTLGRDASSDIVVTDRAASRRHAHVERRRDRFVIVDHSVNGTWVAIDGDVERCLRREELVLRGRGRIALGRATAAAATLIEFRCES